ncbi:hypothetical protein CHS0354_002702 [Potamilus streckersoni]|uniref:Uncharacterized protein n=1 Tax=Potamilus streckersoni TaxID=2493646 RepID=A0AAE0VJH6_9BIVA|nr:hypothetical protein CHS0354_002702 [Potamilus streckersoni]
MACTIGSGLVYPICMLVYGDVTTGFIYNDIYKSRYANQNESDPNITQFPYGDKYKDLFDYMLNHNYTLYFCMIGVGSFVCGYLEFVFWNLSAERQMDKIRKLFYLSVMRQDIGWFDAHKVGELGNVSTQDMQELANGLGDKMALFFQWVVTWIACYVVALSKGWKLAMATMTVCPLLLVWLKNMAIEELRVYAAAGSVAEEVFSAIRTVTAFNGQEKGCKRYEERLSKAHNYATRKGVAIGLGSGAIWFFIFCGLGIAFWYGTELFLNGESGIVPGNVTAIFLLIIIGTTSLAQAFPNLETISMALAAATHVFQIIERKSVIDAMEEKGDIPEVIQGNIEFRNVHFSYPSRPDVQVLNDLSFGVEVGKTVAMVGASGCGKSTVVQLMQRLYDPDVGQILLDGRDIKDLNLRWLREQIGVVSQEPVLFATTIRENIRFGRMDVTENEIERAATLANSHEFICTLPQGYDTLVGERGTQISGGQKQRIAIARALVRNPKILLLDEATSALDNESEVIVQDALEKAKEGRTTIIIAHRLSTIGNANTIYALEDGKVVENGTHSELMQKEGLFYGLVKYQEVMHKESGEEEILEELKRALFDERPLEKSVALIQTTKPTVAKETSEQLVDEIESNNISIKRILLLNSPEWYIIIIGCLLAVISGALQPCFALFLSEFIGVFSAEEDQMRQKAKILFGVIMGTAILYAVIRVLLYICFANAGANLTRRLRRLVFMAIIKQDIAFFDDPQNRVGHLTTRLANDCTLIQGVTGSKLGNVLESVATIIVSLVIVFFCSWKLTLVVLAFLPLMVGVGIIHGKILHGSTKSDRRSLEEASQIFSESVDNMRTVASLTIEYTFIEKYNKVIESMLSKGVRRAFLSGVNFAMFNSLSFFGYAAAFTYGAYLVQNERLSFHYVFRVFSTIIYGGMSIGRHASRGEDFTKAKMAAARLFGIMDRIPVIQSSGNDGKKCEIFSGAVEFKNLSFHYPTRPDAGVLQEISFAIKPGEMLALVGTSGCGKSTIVSLIERFYDPVHGQVLADGDDLRCLNLRWLRSQVGIVSQEPTLFEASITENIAYGDNDRVVTTDEIIQAARNANIHNFVQSLPMGYETNVGPKGTQVSGGQKQRIAIARALLRNPKILLLDEATSALDSECEKVVLEALNKAKKGRTCIVIAQRLSTVQNADKIAIIHKGAVVELGNHTELMARKGVYYKLQTTQQRK